MSYSIEDLRAARRGKGLNPDLTGLVLNLIIENAEPTMGVFLIISDNGDQLSLIRVDKGDGKSEIIQRPDRLTIDQIIQDPQPAKLPALESAMAWLP